MRYVLGIYGGQATTTAVVADETGCLLGTGVSGIGAASGEQEGGRGLSAHVREAVMAAIRAADLQNARIACACLSVSGTRGLMAEEQIEALCAPHVPAALLLVRPRPLAAFYSVTWGRPGIVMLAGREASAYGRNALGVQAHCGGWGAQMGDEGSGLWIAGRALNACCHSHDGQAAPTLLLPLVLDHLGMEDLKHVQRALGEERGERIDIAGLSETVSRAAAQGDKAARRILREAGRELALNAQCVLKRLEIEREPVVVGTVGGVFRAGRGVLRTFREMILQTAPDAQIVPARVPLAVGAALIALEAIDVPLHNDVTANLQSAAPRLQTVKA